jgi:hypothetical protein
MPGFAEVFDPATIERMARKFSQAAPLIVHRHRVLIDAGRSLAGLYSLVATCESRRINSFDDVVDALTRLQDHPANAIDALLPGAWAAARA